MQSTIKFNFYPYIIHLLNTNLKIKHEHNYYTPAVGWLTVVNAAFRYQRRRPD